MDNCFTSHYKDRKCAVNENPSVRIELAQSKTSNNGPLRNGSVVSIARLYVYSKIVCFYESDYAFKTIWRRPCSCHLVKINRYFFQPGRPVFIIVINTSCSGVCYNALAPNGALALFGIFAGRISCNKRPHTQYLLLQHDRSRQTTEKAVLYIIPAGQVRECAFTRWRIVLPSCLDMLTSLRLFCSLILLKTPTKLIAGPVGRVFAVHWIGY